MSTKEAVDLQIKKNAIYASSFKNNYREHRITLLKHKKPELMILGSSRVLDTHSSFFSKSYLNLGQTMASFTDGIEVIRSISKKTKHPTELLISLDFWWFFQDPISKKKLQQSNDSFTQLIHLTFKPIIFLIKGKISFREYIGIIKNGTRYKFELFNKERIGLFALTQGFGFRENGSLFDGRVFLQDSKNLKFKKHITQPQKYLFQPQGRFKKIWDLNTFQINKFKEFVILATESLPNTHLTFFFPGLAPNVYKSMLKSKTHSHITQLQKNIQDLTGINIYDLHNAATYGSLDCEFKDSVHIGNRASARMFLYLSEKNEKIKNILNIKNLKDIINDSKRNIFTPQDDENFKLKERSLTQISC